MTFIVGLEKTCAALNAIFNAAKKVDTALADDGKISLGEGFGIALSGVGLISIFKNIGEILIELKTITPEKMGELIAFFKDAFDLKNDEAEMMVEQGVEVLARLALVVFTQRVLDENLPKPA